MIRAVGYCRFSSEHQTELSIDGQKRAIAYYAQENGYQVEHYYCDRATSGKLAQRPEFQKMLAKAKQDEDIKAVLVYKLDRFSRTTADALHYEAQLNDNDVELVSVMERLDSSPTGNLMKTIIMGMNNFYVDNLSVDVLRGMKEIALQCKATGGIPPLGYKFVEQQYVIHEQEAEIVRLIYKMVDERFGYNKVIDELKARGYRTRKGKAFGKNSLYDILRNERYKGTYTFNKAQKRRRDGSRAGHGGKKPEEEIIRIPHGIPAIVDEATWNRVNRLMDSRKRRAGGEAKAKVLYLLSGIIFCGECGRAMSGNSRHPAPGRDLVISYRCNYKDHNRNCKSREINRDLVEDFVIDQLEKHLFNDEVIPLITLELNKYRVEQGQEAQEAKVKYQVRLNELKRNRGNILDAIAETGMESTFADKLAEIEKETQDMEAKVKKSDGAMPKEVLTEEMVRKYLSSFSGYVKRRNLPKIKEFIKAYVERVDVYNDRIKVAFSVAFFFEEKGIGRIVIKFETERDRRLLKWNFGATKAI